MAASGDPNCVDDPNFATICSFLENFGDKCNIGFIPFDRLQQMLEDTTQVAPDLTQVHIVLLRRIYKSINTEKWEKHIAKFCHSYNSQDAWEIERFGYKKSKIQTKLRLLKNLMESQFDYNLKFKNEVNKLSADMLRHVPLGRDSEGQLYWYQVDVEANLRIYREDVDDDTWQLVATSREEMTQLIQQLTDGIVHKNLVEADVGPGEADGSSRDDMGSVSDDDGSSRDGEGAMIIDEDIGALEAVPSVKATELGKALRNLLDKPTVLETVPETKPMETVAETKPMETVPETKPMETVPETKPMETVQEAKPIDTVPVLSVPVESLQVQPEVSPMEIGETQNGHQPHVARVEETVESDFASTTSIDEEMFSSAEPEVLDLSKDRFVPVESASVPVNSDLRSAVRVMSARALKSETKLEPIALAEDKPVDLCSSQVSEVNDSRISRGKLAESVLREVETVKDMSSDSYPEVNAETVKQSVIETVAVSEGDTGPESVNETVTVSVSDTVAESVPETGTKQVSALGSDEDNSSSVHFSAKEVGIAGKSLEKSSIEAASSSLQNASISDISFKFSSDETRLDAKSLSSDVRVSPDQFGLTINQVSEVVPKCHEAVFKPSEGDIEMADAETLEQEKEVASSVNMQDAEMSLEAEKPKSPVAESSATDSEINVDRMENTDSHFQVNSASLSSRSKSLEESGSVQNVRNYDEAPPEACVEVASAQAQPLSDDMLLVVTIPENSPVQKDLTPHGSLEVGATVKFSNGEVQTSTKATEFSEAVSTACPSADTLAASSEGEQLMKDSKALHEGTDSASVEFPKVAPLPAVTEPQPTEDLVVTNPRLWEAIVNSSEFQETLFFNAEVSAEVVEAVSPAVAIESLPNVVGIKVTLPQADDGKETVDSQEVEISASDENEAVFKSDRSNSEPSLAFSAAKDCVTENRFEANEPTCLLPVLDESAAPSSDLPQNVRAVEESPMPMDVDSGTEEESCISAQEVKPSVAEIADSMPVSKASEPLLERETKSQVTEVHETELLAEEREISGKCEEFEISENSEADDIVENSEVAENVAAIGSSDNLEKVEISVKSETIETSETTIEISKPIEAVEMSEVVETAENDFGKFEILEKAEAVEISETAVAVEILEKAEAVEILEKTEAVEISESVAAIENSTNFETVEIPGKTETVEFSQTAETVKISKMVEAEEIPEAAEAVEMLEVAEVGECSEKAKLVEISESAEADEISETAKADEISETAKAYEMLETAEANEVVEISETAKAVEISETAEAVAISEKVETVEISETAEAVAISEMVETVEISETAKADEMSGTAEVFEISETAKLIEISETTEAFEISETAKADEMSETAEVDEMTEANEVVEISEMAKAVEISETAEAVAISEKVETVEISETAEAVAISEMVETVEISETAKADEMSGTAEVFEISETAKLIEISETTEAFEISETAKADEMSETAEVDEMTEVNEVVEISEMAKAVEISEAAEAVAIPETVEAVEMSEPAEGVEISETAKALEISGTAEAVAIPETVEAVEMSEPAEGVEISKTAKAVEMSETAEAGEMAEADEVVEISKTAKLVEMSETAEVFEISETAKAVEMSETAEVFEISETAKAVEMSETAEMFEISETATAVEMSETAEVVEMAETAEVVEMAETAEAVEMFEISETVEAGGILETAEVGDNAYADEIPETKAVEMSETAEIVQISETAEVVEMSETAKTVEISETAEAVEISETAEAVEISETAEVVEVLNEVESVEMLDTKTNQISANPEIVSSEITESAEGLDVDVPEIPEISEVSPAAAVLGVEFPAIPQMESSTAVTESNEIHKNFELDIPEKIHVQKSIEFAQESAPIAESSISDIPENAAFSESDKTSSAIEVFEESETSKTSEIPIATITESAQASVTAPSPITSVSGSETSITVKTVDFSEVKIAEKGETEVPEADSSKVPETIPVFEEATISSSDDFSTDTARCSTDKSKVPYEVDTPLEMDSILEPIPVQEEIIERSVTWVTGQSPSTHNPNSILENDNSQSASIDLPIAESNADCSEAQAEISTSAELEVPVTETVPDTCVDHKTEISGLGLVAYDFSSDEELEEASLSKPVSEATTAIEELPVPPSKATTENEMLVDADLAATTETENGLENTVRCEELPEASTNQLLDIASEATTETAALPENAASMTTSEQEIPTSMEVLGNLENIASTSDDASAAFVLNERTTSSATELPPAEIAGEMLQESGSSFTQPPQERSYEASSVTRAHTACHEQELSPALTVVADEATLEPALPASPVTEAEGSISESENMASASTSVTIPDASQPIRATALQTSVEEATPLDSDTPATEASEVPNFQSVLQASGKRKAEEPVFENSAKCAKLEAIISETAETPLSEVASEAPLVGEAIEEEMMFISGEGSGAELEGGNIRDGGVATASLNLGHEAESSESEGSSEDEAVPVVKRKRGRPKGAGAGRKSATPKTETPKKRGRKPKAVQPVHDLDESSNASANSTPTSLKKRPNGRLSVELPTRQSSRIAKIQEKEEEQRRRLEEERLAQLKAAQLRKQQQQLERDSKQVKPSEDGDSKPVKPRKGRPPKSDSKYLPTPSGTDSEDEEIQTAIQRSKKRGRKRKHEEMPKTLMKKGLNPWIHTSSEDEDEAVEEEEEDHDVHEEEEEDLTLRSDHEFSPESDMGEDDEDASPSRHARTVKRGETKEDKYAETNCNKCGKGDHPEWILLCDSCDKGWHASCLRPVTWVIPEGQWFCPPCQHKMLIGKLNENLVEYDKVVKKHELEVLRKQRLAYVGISLDNVLPRPEEDQNGKSSAKDKKRKKRMQINSSEDEEDELMMGENRDRFIDDREDSSGLSKYSSGESEDEPMYKLRARRATKSFNFKEYDEMINSALRDEDEYEAPVLEGEIAAPAEVAVSQENGETEVSDPPPPKLAVSKGKVMPGSSEGEEEEEEPAKEEAESSEEEVDEAERNRRKQLEKQSSRKARRRLNDLDATSDEDSDEDFKGSEEDDEEDEAFAVEDEDSDWSGDRDADESDDSIAKKGKKGKLGRQEKYLDVGSVRRSSRKARSRIIYDESEQEDDKDGPAGGWDSENNESGASTVSESDDETWGKRKKKKAIYNPQPSKMRKSSFFLNAMSSSSQKSRSKGRSSPKKKKKVDDDEVDRAWSKHGGKVKRADTESSTKRSTRGKQIDFKVILESGESDDDGNIHPKRKKPVVPDLEIDNEEPSSSKQLVAELNAAQAQAAAATVPSPTRKNSKPKITKTAAAKPLLTTTKSPNKPPKPRKSSSVAGIGKVSPKKGKASVLSSGDESESSKLAEQLLRPIPAPPFPPIGRRLTAPAVLPPGIPPVPPAAEPRSKTPPPDTVTPPLIPPPPVVAVSQPSTNLMMSEILASSGSKRQQTPPPVHKGPTLTNSPPSSPVPIQIPGGRGQRSTPEPSSRSNTGQIDFPGKGTPPHRGLSSPPHQAHTLLPPSEISRVPNPAYYPPSPGMRFPWDRNIGPPPPPYQVRGAPPLPQRLGKIPEHNNSVYPPGPPPRPGYIPPPPLRIPNPGSSGPPPPPPQSFQHFKREPPGPPPQMMYRMPPQGNGGGRGLGPPNILAHLQSSHERFFGPHGGFGGPPPSYSIPPQGPMYPTTQPQQFDYRPEDAEFKEVSQPERRPLSPPPVTKEETKCDGEFGGLVSYFSSQRGEEDLDT